MLDRGEPDDKILSVPVHDPYQQEFFDIADIPQHMLKEVEHFFRTYKDLEGKRVGIQGWGKSDEATRIVLESVARYEVTYGKKNRTSGPAQL
jgi:inorganic pyrophosphatase